MIPAEKLAGKAGNGAGDQKVASALCWQKLGRTDAIKNRIIAQTRMTWITQSTRGFVDSIFLMMSSVINLTLLAEG